MRRKVVSFPLSFCLFAAAYLNSTFRAVFGPVGAGNEQHTADGAVTAALAGMGLRLRAGGRVCFPSATGQGAGRYSGGRSQDSER